MTSEVLDFYSPKAPSFYTCIKSKGYTGIARYLTESETDERQITPQEVANAHAAGLEIHFFFENNPVNPPASFFTFAKGVEHAQAALARLQWLGAPVSVVYFAIDNNLPPDQLTKYFNGIESITTTTPGIIPGAYGYQNLCEYARANWPDIAKHLAQTYGAVTGPLDLWQHLQMFECGVEVDVNDATVKGWEPPVATPSYVGQSVADVNLVVGQVAQVDGVWNYPNHGGNRTIIAKVYGTTPGIRVVTLYPPADPDADPTIDTAAQPAYFIVATRQA